MKRNGFASSKVFAHLIAFLTVAVWGITFVSTKVLINGGLSPAQIFLFRFLLAYLAIWFICPKRRASAASAPTQPSAPEANPTLHYNNRGINPLGDPVRPNPRETKPTWFQSLFADNWIDETILALLGITGGSLYFMTENEALRFSTASNVALIVCVTPLLTTLLLSIFYHAERLNKMQWAGSLVAFCGMVLVVLNGHFVLHLSPLGDSLAFGAALCWAFYSLLIKRVSEKYPAVFITRKIFFYGLLTILPYFAFFPGMPGWSTLLTGPVIGNLLFLGLIASMLCFVSWNWCITRIGAVNATNYIYFNPLVTIVTAWLILGEHVTLFIALGACLILSGMYLVERKR
jgi:drug/metabolite transporter (DMT)-like permease